MIEQAPTQEEQARRGADGKVAFGLSALAFAALLFVLLDRVGAPDLLIGSLGPLAAVCALAAIGVTLRNMRVSRFYAAGRAVPAPYTALAVAGLAFALFAPFLPPDGGGASLADLLAGFAGGVLVATLATGPLLRKTGAFSLADLLAARFPELALRLGVVAVVAVSSLFVATAGFEMAVRGLQTCLRLDRGPAVVLATIALLCVCVPGGLSGVAWAAMGAAAMLLVGLALPLAAMIAQGSSLPAPGIGDAAAWSAATARLAQWSDAASGLHPIIIFALSVGIGTLAPLLLPAIGASGRVNAHRAGRGALLWMLVLAALACVTIAASTLSLDATTIGHKPGELPDLIYRASAHGLVAICGQAVDGPISALADCVSRPGFADVLRPFDVSARGAFLLTALPDLRRLGESYSGLAAAGVVSADLALTAAAFHCFATALGHDAIYRLGAAGALTSRRLAITRAILLVAIVGAALSLLTHSVETQEMTSMAAAFSASALAPALILTFWPRAVGADALFALLCGLGVAEFFIVLGGGPPSFSALMTGAGVACAVGTAAGFVASLFRRPDPLRGGGVFFDRIVHGYGDVLNPDKGA